MAEQESKQKTSDDENSKSEKTGENSSDGAKQKTPLLEWIVAGIGLILVVGAIGFMLYQAVSSTSAPPVIEIKVESAVANKTGYLVVFEARNTGEQTASNVAIEGEIKNGDESVEKSGVAMDYIPSHSVRKGGLYFTKNPQPFDLQVRAEGYEKP